MKLWTWVLAALMLLAGFNAEAARFGGGRSFGRQSSNVTQRQAAPRFALDEQISRWLYVDQ